VVALLEAAALVATAVWPVMVEPVAPPARVAVEPVVRPARVVQEVK